MIHHTLCIRHICDGVLYETDIWCIQYASKCPNNCNGHGQCEPSTGQCDCTLGWNINADCSVFLQQLTENDSIVSQTSKVCVFVGCCCYCFCCCSCCVLCCWLLLLLLLLLMLMLPLLLCVVLLVVAVIVVSLVCVVALLLLLSSGMCCVVCIICGVCVLSIRVVD